MKLGLTYIPSHLPDHIKRDMAVIKSIGCGEVLFTIQENHVNTLDGAVRFGAVLAKKSGIVPYVVLWGFANTFGGGRMSNLMLDNQDVWRVGRNGVRIPLGCLNNPKLANGFLKFTGICRDHGFEGIFIDEPTPQECFCEICRKKFHEMSGGDLLTAGGSEEYRQFQCQTVVTYTANVCAAVKTMDRRLKTFCCVMPLDKECFQAVAKIPELDVFATDPYWLVEKNKNIEWAVELATMAKKEADANGKESQVWLNLWKIPSGREPEVYSGGKKLAEVGCDSLYAWSYKGGLGTPEECENPARAWKYFCKLYRELSGQG